MMQMTTRDVEILRTVGRVKILRTASLLGVFFRQPRVAQRRLAVLRDAGLIVGHRKGAVPHSGNAGPHYWRLTRLGAELLSERFPEEEWCERAAKAARISVRFFEHQDTIVSLYLRLIADKDLDEMRAKASSIVFVGDHDVAIPIARVGKERELYPDATVWGTSGNTRLFVEVDRSTQSRKRIAGNVDAYSFAFSLGNADAPFGDGRTPYLVYVTMTKARRDGLRHALRWSQTRGLKPAIFTFEEAVQWLHHALFGGEALGVDALLSQGLTLSSFSEAEQHERTVAALRALYSEHYAHLGKHGEPSTPALSQAWAVLRSLNADEGIVEASESHHGH